MLTCAQNLKSVLYAILLATSAIPFLLPLLLRAFSLSSPQYILLLKCFSLLLLGIFLATLATVNFSLSLAVGLFCAPLSLIGPLPASFVDNRDREQSTSVLVRQHLVLQLISPPLVFVAVCWATKADVTSVLSEASFAWRVEGVWSPLVVWCVWWPAWLAAAAALSPGTKGPGSRVSVSLEKKH